MDAERFDRWTRSLPLSRMVSRRALGGLVVGAVALGQAPAAVRAGPGCRNFGARCGNPDQCCSGICTGPPSNPRRKKCRAHDVRGCRPGQDSCRAVFVPCTTIAGVAGRCVTTTGNAPYCAGDVTCQFCARDADCHADFGPRAACVSCPGCSGESGRACGSVENFGG